MYWTGKTSRRF